MNKLYSFNRKKEYSKIIISNKLIFKYFCRLYPSFTVASISPDFSPVFELTKKYFMNGFVLCLDVELEILG